MAKKVVTFGEIMLRLSTPGFQRFQQADSFDVTYGGGEANVAVSLAYFNLDAYFVTRVPDNPIGQSAVNHLRRFGVKTDYIARGGKRLGIYFLESGSSQRPSKVVYDRAHSAIAEAGPRDFDWEEIFKGADWFHFTGITSALGEKTAALTLEAVKVAREAGVTVSVDLNYRKNLWTTARAGEVMSSLVPYADVCIANEEDAEKVFGIHAGGSEVTSGQLSDEGYRAVARELRERFGFKYAAITLRESFSASHNGWAALLYDGREYYTSRRYDILPIVDRVGGGDSFCAGLIYGLVSGKGCGEALHFAVAASCLKHTIPGDFNLVTAEEVELLAGGDSSGRVQR
ncbi:MAG: sugar kinase [Bacillota bacterium]